MRSSRRAWRGMYTKYTFAFKRVLRPSHASPAQYYGPPQRLPTMASPYLLVSAATLLVHGFLGLYVLSKNPRSTPHRVFALVALSFALWSAGDFLMRFAPDEAAALFWFRSWLVFVALMCVAMAHFTFVFPRPIPYDFWFAHLPGRPPIQVKPWLAVGTLYATPLLFAFFLYGPLPTEVYVRRMVAFPWGWVPEYETGNPFPFLSLGLLVAFMARAGDNIRRGLAGASPIERRQIKWVAAGAIATLNIAGLFDTVFIYAGVPTPLFGSWPTSFAAVTSAYAILRYRFLVVSPQAEAERPSAASRDEALAPGRCVLVKEPRPERSLALFSGLVFQGVPGLAVTRQPPVELRNHLGLEKTPILWLGRRSPGGEPALYSLHDLFVTAEDFLRKAPGSALLIDGFTYLTEHHGFSPTLKLLQDLRELVLQTGGRLIVPVDPRTLETLEMARLEAELKPA